MEDPPPLSRAAQAAWFGVLPLLLYLLLTGAGASNGAYLTPFRVLSLGLLVATFVVWAVAAVRYPIARPRSTLAWGIVAAVAALAVSTLLSDRSRLGWEYVAYGVILAGLYLLLVRLFANPGIGRRIVIVTAVVTLVIGMAYIVAVAVLWVEWWGLVGRLAVPPTRPGYEALMYGAPGILTAFLVTSGAASVALMWSWGRGARVTAVLIAVVVAIDVVIASARSAWVGVAAGLLIAGIAALATGQRVRLPRSTRGRAALAAGVAVGAVAMIGLAPTLLRRLTSGGGEDLRATLAAVSLRLFADHPLAGAGPGTWVTWRATYTAAGETDYYIPHAHNVPLQTLAETGLVGAAAALVLVGLLLRLVIRALRGASAAERHWAIGVLFIAPYLLVHQLFDFFMDMPAVLFAASLPIAALDAAAVARVPAEIRASVLRSWRAAVVPVIAAVTAIGLLVLVERPATLAEAAVEAFPSDPDRALSLASEAARLDPGLTAYDWVVSMAEDASGDPSGASDGFQRVADHDDLPQAWINVAALAAARGADQEAAASIDRALRLGSQQTAVRLFAVPVLLEIGDDERATQLAADVLLAAPSIADDPWWERTSGLADVRDRAVDVAIESTGASAWPVAMFAGRVEEARAVASGLDPSGAAHADLVIDAWAGVPGARAELEAAALADPLGGNPGWAARVAAREGDDEAAARFHRMAILGFGTTGGDFGDDVVVADLFAGASGPGSNGDYHFRYTYRRSTPALMVVREVSEWPGP